MNSTRSFILACLTTSVCWAQGLGNSDLVKGTVGAVTTADARWSGITAALTPAGKAKVSISPGRSDLTEAKTAIVLQADKARQVAADAKAFYTEFPLHPNAETARKIEVISELHGVKDGDAVQLKKAQDLATTFRKDTARPLGARTEVALAADRLALSQKIKAKQVADRASEKEKLADAIRAEFGQSPELISYYSEVARSADMFTGKRIATNLLLWSSDKKVRSEAQLILDRNALIGQKINLPLNSAQTGPVNLSQATGTPIVLFVWTTTSGENMLKSLDRFQNSLPAGVQFIYLALGGNAKEAEAMAGAAAMRGRFYHQPANTFGPTLAALKVKNVPYIFVLDREAKVVGYGPVGELTNVLSLAR